MKFHLFPELKTGRLLLRKIEESDCDIILFLRSDKTVNKFIERPEHRKTKNKTDAINFIKEINENFKNKNSYTWGITLKDNPAIVGTICLWNFSNDRKIAEVGYDLSPSYQGKGIMDEALKGIIDFGFNNLKLSKITAYTHKANESSIRLLKNNKFQLIENRNDEDNANNIIFEIESQRSGSYEAPKAL